MVADPITLTVFDPTGTTNVSQSFAPRLDTLAGKTICELWNGSFEGLRTFSVITQLLQKEFPTAKIITHDKMPVIRHSARGIFPELEDAVRAAGIQAAIIGNAG